MRAVKVGICGLGTVGSGVFNLLHDNRDEISRRCGRAVELVQVGCRRDHPDCDLSSVRVSREVREVAANGDLDVFVELIGGTDVALELVKTATANGTHVVTANKALIAQYGAEIFELAAGQGVSVAFEASVAGGIPIVKALREGLAANRIHWLAGIINGTTNFILTEMESKQRSFDEVLGEAQALGYAEADPTFDVEGIDAAHKLTILSSIAFGVPLNFDGVYTEGIGDVTLVDMAFADRLGYRIKHLGITAMTDAGVELRVHPTLVPKTDLIAKVDGVMNAVLVGSDAAGPTLYCGAGAGSRPTASAVVADVIDIARAIDSAPDTMVRPMGYQADRLRSVATVGMDKVVCAFYLRLDALDEPGVMASISTVLSDSKISIESLIQQGEPDEDGSVPIVILTNRVEEARLNAALEGIHALAGIKGTVNRIRVETLNA